MLCTKTFKTSSYTDSYISNIPNARKCHIKHIIIIIHKCNVEVKTKQVFSNLILDICVRHHELYQQINIITRQVTLYFFWYEPCWVILEEILFQYYHPQKMVSFGGLQYLIIKLKKNVHLFQESKIKATTSKENLFYTIWAKSILLVDNCKLSYYSSADQRHQEKIL